MSQHFFVGARQRGFTLIEAIIAITIIGILAAVVAVFIRAPIQGYADSLERAELTDTADLALRRIARDLRTAVPNSVRVISPDTIEFIPILTGGRYLAAEDGFTQPVLDFTTSTKRTFTVVGPWPSGKAAIDVNNINYVVVNNLGIGFDPANAYGGGNIARISAVTPAANVVQIQPNPFPSQSTPMPSPTSRFQIAMQPVSYVCATGASGNRVLSRQWNYGFSATQGAAPVATSADSSSLSGAQYRLLAGRVANCSFDYSSLGARRGALVVITLELRPRNSTDPTVRLVHQVHVDNTP